MDARGQLGNFLWAQKLRCAGDFFKVSLKFKIAATDQLQFFVGTKTQTIKLRNYSNFTITFPTIWRCAGDFLKVLLKFKFGRHG